MSYSVKSLATFDRQAKRLTKKYPSLKSELAGLIASLKKNPEQGTPLGNNCYKIRLAIASKLRGKSGGARVITYLIFSRTTIYLVSIYDKSEVGTISARELNFLLAQIKNV
ncbi:MAG TPA: hypothetical protein VI757_07265 [Bacteroidia bacterium]|nr:hypothetical protein [Bacteroidia bacterium]